jgi:hypothetical protein
MIFSEYFLTLNTYLKQCLLGSVHYFANVEAEDKVMAE